MSLQLPLDVAQWPQWAVPAIGGGCAVVVLLLGYLLFGKTRSPFHAGPWQGEPMVPSYDRPRTRLQDPRRTSDKRTALRRTGNPVDVQITDPEARRPPRSGMVVDRSLGGLCLAVETPYEVNGVLCVRPACDSSLPWIKVTVKNCRHVGNGYQLGCGFLHVPPSSILMLFG